jgi:diguanylate cyclase (GGDEF)-like protein/PAS domain S-box-containing protein
MARDSQIIRAVRLGFLVIGLFIIVVGLISSFTATQANDVQRQINRTSEIIYHTDDILINLGDLIGAERAYVITGRHFYIDTINSAMISFRENVEALEAYDSIVQDYASQMSYIWHAFEELQQDIVQPLTDYAARTQDGKAFLSSIEDLKSYSSLSRYYKDTMTRELNVIKHNESVKLDQMVSATVRNLKRERALNIFGTLIALIIMILMYRMITQRIRSASAAQQKLEHQLQESRDDLADVVEGTRAGTWKWEIPTGKIVLNERWAEISGYTLDELQPINIQTVRELCHPDDLQASLELMDEVFSRDRDYYDNELRVKHRDGHWVWIRDRGKVTAWLPDGRPLIMSGTHDEITERKQMEEELFLEKEQLRATLLSVGDGIITTDASGKIEMMNRIAESLTGWSAEDAKGKSFATVFITENAKTGAPGDNPVSRVLETQQATKLHEDTVLYSRDQKRRFIEDSAAPITDQAGNLAGVVLVFRDVTEKREEQEAIVRLGLTDQLTQVHNRRSYELLLSSFSAQHCYPLAFLITDVNGLKLTNDAFGHDMGDALLIQVAQILQAHCENDDAVVRLGGDEFVVLMPHTDEERVAQQMVKINEALAGAQVGPLPISVSLGFALKESAASDNGMVLRKAESRMYRNKIVDSPRMKQQTIDLLLSYQHDQHPVERIHSKRVEQLSKILAQAAGLSKEEVDQVTLVARYHDIGKIAIDQKLLQKHNALEESEWFDVRRHTDIGYNLLRSIPEYFSVADAVLSHHERWDGTGYPQGLSGQNIPLAARIVSICDSYEAMVGKRSYSTPRSHEEACEEILTCAGTQFDPHLVQVVPCERFAAIIN